MTYQHDEPTWEFVEMHKGINPNGQIWRQGPNHWYLAPMRSSSGWVMVPVRSIEGERYSTIWVADPSMPNVDPVPPSLLALAQMLVL